MRFTLAGALLLVATFPLAAQAQAGDPRAPVQALSDGLITIMKAGASAGRAGRAATIGPVVDKSFDIPAMTRLAIGAPWTTLSPADQSGLVAAFRRLTVAQYAANFDGYSGQSIAVDPNVSARGTDRLVRTTLKDPKDGPIAISYRLRGSGGGWRIIDVYYRNSVSQLAIRRADFASVLQKGGARALIAHLDQLAARSTGF